MSEKVVSLRTGVEILPPGEVCPETVTVLERLLVKARSGEIQGVVAVVVHSDGAIGSDWNAGLLVTYQLVGRLLQMTNEFAGQAGNRG